MDPNANLAQQADLVILAQNDTLSNQGKRNLSELRRALQGWIGSGGFDPDWTAYPEATKAYRAWVRKSAKFADLYR